MQHHKKIELGGVNRTASTFQVVFSQMLGKVIPQENVLQIMVGVFSALAYVHRGVPFGMHLVSECKGTLWHTLLSVLVAQHN